MIECDYGLISVSDCVLRIEGESEGADLEVEFACLVNIEVCYTFEELIKCVPVGQE